MSKTISPKKKFRHFTWTINGTPYHSTVMRRITIAQFAKEASKDYTVSIKAIKITGASN